MGQPPLEAPTQPGKGCTPPPDRVGASRSLPVAAGLASSVASLFTTCAWPGSFRNSLTVRSQKPRIFSDVPFSSVVLAVRAAICWASSRG